MSIKTCFSALNAGTLKRTFEAKLDNGISEEVAAAETLKEHNDYLQNKLLDFKKGLGIDATKPTGLNTLDEFLAQETTLPAQTPPVEPVTPNEVVNDTVNDTVNESNITFTHKLPNGEFVTSFKDALQATEEGQDIQIGMMVEGEFLPMVNTKKNTNKNTEQGYINNMIANGYLAPEKVNSKGNYVFEAAGDSELYKIMSSEIINDDSTAYLGMDGVVKDGYTFTFDKKTDSIKITNSQGQIEQVDEKEIARMSYKELNKKYGSDTALNVITEREWSATKQAYRENKPVIKNADPTMKEGDLQVRLLNLLNKMGVKTMAISEYVRKYNIKNGVNPSARALADIANQIVAYTEGRTEDLAEETSHFINEALPQDQVENVLRNIHKTQEWAEFSEIYREIYRDEYPADKLDEAVRREVLGKVVAKVIINKGNINEGTDTQRNIFSKVVEVVNDFFKRISDLFKPQYKLELESYLGEVEKLLTQEDISSSINTDNFKHNTFRLYSIQGADPYSTNEKLRKRAQALTIQLMDAEKQYMKTGTGRRSNIKKLETIQEQLQTQAEITSITSLISMLNSNVRALEAAIKDSEKKNKPYFLTDEENILYQFVKSVGENAVGELKQLVIKEHDLNPSQGANSWEPIINELTATSQKITDLKSKVSLIDSKNIEKLVNTILDKHNIPEQDRPLVEKWIERAEKDTNLFHATFGQLVHAKDGLLNLGGNIIRKMHNEAQAEFFAATKDYQDKLRELGVSSEDVANFTEGGYIMSETNFEEFNKDLDIIFVEEYKRTTGESIPALEQEIATEDARTNKDEGKIDSLKERFVAYTSYQTLSNEELIKMKNGHQLHALRLNEQTRQKNLSRPRTAAITERVMKDEYYDKYQRTLEQANVSQRTIQDLSILMSDLGDLREKAYRKDGGKIILDYSRLSEADIESLNELQRRRKAMKSYTDAIGTLKDGLRYSIINGESQLDPETNQPIVEVDPNQTLSDEARAAIDIHNLDRLLTAQRKVNGEEKKSSQLFFDTLDKIDQTEGRESALRFLELNSYMTFSQEFWDGLGNTGGIIAKLNNIKEILPEEAFTAYDLITAISQLTFEMKNSLKTNSKKGNPAEINVGDMTAVVRESILDKHEQLRDYLNKAKSLIKSAPIEDDVEVEEEEFLGKSDINEAYRAVLERERLLEVPSDSRVPDLNLEKALNEARYAKDHMANSDAESITGLINSIDYFLQGRSTTVSKQTQRILDDMGMAVSELHDANVNAQVIRTAVREKLVPYYKRFTSKSYTDFYENLKSTDNLSEALQGDLAEEAMVEISPNTSFFDSENNDQLNPNYDSNFEGGYIQPKKLQKYKSRKFEQMFGTITKNADGTSTSSKNGNMYKAYLTTLDYNRKAMEAMNIGENHNKFLLPQIRKTLTEKVRTFGQGQLGQNIRNFSKDVFNYTEDDMVQGDQTYGNDVKIIPKMYISSLDNPEDVSTDLFYSLTLRAKEAYLRRSKVKHYGDLMSIHDKILTREMGGKTPLASNTYKMFKSAIDYNLFGVKESVTYPITVGGKTFDLTKLARMLLNFVKFRNLGLNIVIPVTSLLTGAVTRRMEAFVGEFIDRRSQNLGTREYNKLATDGMKEIGVVNTRAKINVLGQFYKAFDMNESFRNSKYGYLLRNMPRTGMALYAAANFPLYGTTLLGILHDFRVVDGKVMNKNTFKKIRSADNLTKKDLETQWKSYEGQAIYKFIKHEGNRVDYDKQALSNVLMKDGAPLNEEQLTEEINDMHNNIQGNIQYVNSIIDGQIPEDDRVYAQRHYLLSYFMTHRGWLSINIARKFKNRHLNLDTGVVEEGSYRSLFGYLGDFTKEWKDSNFIKFVGSFKAAWDKADDAQRKNMKRVAVEMGTLTTLMMVGMVLRAAAEDDKNKDLFALQAANYLMFRTINEISSVQFNTVTNFSDTIESPFVGWTTIKNITSIGDVLSGEEVKYGTYKGMTKRTKYLTKMVPGMKQIFDLQNMNQTFDTYKFYNKKNVSMTPVGFMEARLSGLMKEDN